MGCCNDKKKHPCHGLPDKFIDVSCIKSKEWDEVPALLGLTECNHVVPVDKPLFELTEDDRDKLNSIIIDGNGDSALYDDGTYKETYTKEEADNAVDTALKEAVLYDNENNITPRNNIVLENGKQILGKSLTGGRHNLLQITTDNSVITGDIALPYTINSLSRPKVNAFNNGGYQVNEVAYKADIDELSENVTAIGNDVNDLKGKVATVEAKTEQNTTSISDLQASTEAAFNTVNQSLTDLDDRVHNNTVNIETNTSDIEALREDLTNQEKFRGYYETTDQILAIENPTNGDYAWNAQTGTVYIYNGTTWYNTTVPIPDQSVDAYDAVPRMDGEGDAGSTNRYSRGDHRHPSDDSKANVTDLDNYLALTGNTQTTRMSGDIWLSTGGAVRLTNSGNSYINQDSATNTTQIIGNGVGGVNIQSPNGTVKANGDRVITETEYNDTLADISALQSDVSGNSSLISGLRSDVNTNTANISDLQNTANQHATLIQSNTDKIAINTSDIESIQEELAQQEHFRGWFATTAEITAIPNPTRGDYAFNGQDGKVWAYNGTTWYQTQNNVPDQTVDAYDGLPLIDGVADAGTVNQYSRGNHRHPTDITRASATALTATNNTLSELSSNFNDYVSSTNTTIDSIQTNVSSNSGNISTLQGRVSTAETNISTLQSQATTIGEQVNNITTDVADLTGRVSTNESDIASLQSEVTNSQRFRGYYETTTEITQLPATSGDFAWNAQTGTVWIYDASVPSWTDSGTKIPDSAIRAYNALPVIDGEANAGESNDYARGDHRHPTDTTRAALSDIPTEVSQLTNDSGYITPDDLPDLTNFLPLSGGTINGDLRVSGQLFYDGKQLSSSDNIDMLFTDGQYRWIPTSGVQGTFPTDYYNASQSSSVLLVWRYSANSVYQLLFNNGYSWFRRQTASVTYLWNTIVSTDMLSSHLSSYLQTTGGTINGNLNINGLANYNGSEIATINQIPDISGYLPLSGGTITGNLSVNGTANYNGNVYYKNKEVATKSDIPDISGYLPLTGGNITGNLTVNSNQVATVNQIPDVSVYLPLSGGTIIGDLAVNGDLNAMGVSSIGDIAIESTASSGTSCYIYAPDNISIGEYSGRNQTNTITNVADKIEMYGNDITCPVLYHTTTATHIYVSEDGINMRKMTIDNLKTLLGL